MGKDERGEAVAGSRGNSKTGLCASVPARVCESPRPGSWESTQTRVTDIVTGENRGAVVRLNRKIIMQSLQSSRSTRATRPHDDSDDAATNRRCEEREENDGCRRRDDTFFS